MLKPVSNAKRSYKNAEKPLNLERYTIFRPKRLRVFGGPAFKNYEG